MQTVLCRRLSFLGKTLGLGALALALTGCASGPTATASRSGTLGGSDGYLPAPGRMSMAAGDRLGMGMYHHQQVLARANQESRVTTRRAAPATVAAAGVE